MQVNEGSIGRHQLQEVRPFSYHRRGNRKEKKGEGQHAQYWEPSTNRLQELREVNLQELQEADLQEVREVQLEEAQESEPVKVRSEEKGQLADLQELQEADVQEVEQVLLQEVEPVASLQEVVQLPWLAGLTRSRKVGNSLGQEEERLLLQEVKPVYKGTSQRRTPPSLASKSHPSLVASRGIGNGSTLPKRRLISKLDKKRFEEKPESKSRTVKRQSLKTNSEKEEEVAGEVFTVRKLKTQFIPAEAAHSEKANPRFPSRAVKRSYSSAPTRVNHFQRVRPVSRGSGAGERPNGSGVGFSLPGRAEDDYQSLLTPNIAPRKIPQRYQDIPNGVKSKSESYSFEKGEGGTQIIITLTNSPNIRLWQASSPDSKGNPPPSAGSSYTEKEEVDLDENEDFDVGPVIAAVTAEEEEEQRRVPDRQFSPPREEQRKGNYTKVSVRGSVSAGSPPSPQGPPRVRLYDHPHSDHHRPGECDDGHDAHHHHEYDHRYRNSMPRPVIAAVTAELEEPEDTGPAPPSPPPPGPPSPPPTQRPRPISTARPVPVIPAVVGPTYKPPTSYLPPSRPAPPPGRPRPSYKRPKPTNTGLGASYSPPTGNRPSSASTQHFTPVANPSEVANPSSPANSLASSNHYHIHVTSPRQLTQVLSTWYCLCNTQNCQLLFPDLSINVKAELLF